MATTTEQSEDRHIITRGLLVALAILCVVAGTLLAAAPAKASDDQVPPRLSAQVVCVSADFPVLGSGWKVHAGADAWNAAQTTVRFTFTREAGCADVIVHRYSSTTDGRCAYTAWDRTWSTVTQNARGQWVVTGADVYLNDACVGVGPKYTRRTMAHELGHAMGLPHSDSSRSVMNTANLWPIPSDIIGPIDVRNLTLVYA